MNKDVILLLLLLVPAVHALSLDNTLYVQGQPIVVHTGGQTLTVQTPDGIYTLLGTSNDVSFPTSTPGRYVFKTPGATVSATVSRAYSVLLRSANGASTVQAATDGTQTRIDIPGFTDVRTQGMPPASVRITPDMGRRWGFADTYAADPGNGAYTLTRIAKGSKLYKCANYDYAAERCNGGWSYLQSITPGAPYTIRVTGSDPAFGEGSTQGTPDSCLYTDESGAGTAVNADCLSEVQTANNGTTVQVIDNEGSGGTSHIDVNFTNTLSVQSITAVNVTYRYQRVTNTQVGATTASFQIYTAGAWTTACTTTVPIGTWGDYTCDLSAYITTQAQANNVVTRVVFSTAKSGKPSSTGTVYVDEAYLSMDYVYADIYPPTYSNIASQPTSPKTYDGVASNFSADWTDDVGVTTVYREDNFTGTVQNTTVTGGPTYQSSATLGAGTYEWRELATDAAGNWNDTMPYQTYVVDKATGQVYLTLNGTHGDLTIDQGRTVTIGGTRTAGETTMLLYENGSLLTSGTSISLPRTYNTPGEYNLTLSMAATQNYTAAQESWNLTVLDVTPPGPITSLTNQSAGQTWIYWTWTNPPDTDYSHAEVSINGTFYANVTTPHVNVTGLLAGTLYQIAVRTVDTSGNVNTTSVTGLGQTLTSTDVTPPSITSVAATNIQDSEATITWLTNEIADSVVKYGTTSGSYTNTNTNHSYTTTHSATLTGLVPSTIYYYVVNSSDPAANSNQSAQYSFTTGPDVTPPRYGSTSATPASGSTYPLTATFNATWTDNGALGMVDIEDNFTGAWRNDTMTAVGGGLYTFTAALAAGNYSWRSVANDTAGNRNNSMAYMTYTVAKAAGQARLLLNASDANLTVDQDIIVNVTAQRTAGEGKMDVLENGTSIGTGSPPVYVLKNYTMPGTYLLTARLNATQNYTAAQANHTLTVLDTQPPSVTLIQPFDGKTSTLALVQFDYLASDNVAVRNCTLYVDGTANQTNGTITGGTNRFWQTFNDGVYTWNVGCTDTSGNAANASAARTLNVSIIPPWIPTDANHSVNGNVTSQVNASDNVTTSLNKNEIVTVDTWSHSAPSNANVSGVTAYCEIDSAVRGAQLYFEYYTGTNWSADVCPGAQDGVGTFSCDLYAQGVTSVSALNALQVRCIDRDADASSSSQATLDYVYVQPDWTLIQKPDFAVADANLTLPVSPSEGETVTLHANVSNIGVVGATALVEFYADGTPIGNSSVLIDAGGMVEFNQTWTAHVGQSNISVVVDPLGTVSELNETNNNASGLVNVSLWQTYYGNTYKRFLALASGNQFAYNWSNSNLQGNIFAADADANVNVLALQALTRTPSGTYNFSELSAADSHLGSAGLPDSINATYSNGGALKATQTFTVFGTPIANVPTVNSTNTSSFVTGILYDTSDGTGGYDGTQDLVFITRVNQSHVGKYGTYDYELTVPAFLRNDTPGTNAIDLFIEIT